jgi:hypothetical protein
MTAFTTNMMKGGAMLDDAARLAEAWQPELSASDNLQRVSDLNLLGKTTRARTDDVLLRILKPRFVDPGDQVMQALGRLLMRPDSFREACYYETSRDDALLAAFAEGPLYESYQRGRTTITVDEVKLWMADLSRDGQAPEWTDIVRTKVARGILAALRDFGILEGANHKRFATPRMTPLGFAYVAYREHEQGVSSRGIVESRVWRRWLLSPDRVTELFTQAERLGVLRYLQVGSSVRVDWIAGSLQEVARAAA